MNMITLSKTLTPNQIWQNYNLENTPLRLSINKKEKFDSYSVLFCAADILTANDGVVRAKIKYYVPNINCLGSVIIVPDKQAYFNETLLNDLLSKDYAVLVFDYSNKGSENIIYPDSLSYGYYKENNPHDETSKLGVLETCQYLWAKVTRKMIDIVYELNKSDEKIILIGVGSGNNRAWQVSAMDSRVYALISIIDLGKRSLTSAIEDFDMPYLVGCITESYISLTPCPVLFLTTTNNSCTPLNRSIDIFNNIKNKNSRLAIYKSSKNLVCSDYIETVSSWLSHLENAEETFIYETSFVTENNKLYLNIEMKDSINISEIKLNYCYNKPNDNSYWQTQNISLDMSGRGKATIKVYENTLQVSAYADIYYKNGARFSTKPTTIQDIVNVTKVAAKNHIIYDRNLGNDVWIIDKGTFSYNKNDIYLGVGALGIYGVGSLSGYLSTYIVNEIKSTSNSDNILQLDAFSEKEIDFTVAILVEDEGKTITYTSKVNLTEVQEWEKVNLSVLDFKDENLLPLKEWGKVSKLTFSECTGVLFNNILWI